MTRYADIEHVSKTPRHQPSRCISRISWHITIGSQQACRGRSFDHSAVLCVHNSQSVGRAPWRGDTGVWRARGSTAWQDRPAVGRGVRPRDPVIRRRQAQFVIEIIERDLSTTYNCFGKRRRFVVETSPWHGPISHSVSKVLSRSRRRNHSHAEGHQHHHCRQYNSFCPCAVKIWPEISPKYPYLRGYLLIQMGAEVLNLHAALVVEAQNDWRDDG